MVCADLDQASDACQAGDGGRLPVRPRLEAGRSQGQGTHGAWVARTLAGVRPRPRAPALCRRRAPQDEGAPVVVSAVMGAACPQADGSVDWQVGWGWGKGA